MLDNIFHKVESKPLLTIVLLFCFHFFIAILLFLVASSDYLSHLHNGEGLWNFARDSTRYHEEAIRSTLFLQESQWLSWWRAYPTHLNVKIISLIYWLAGYKISITFEIVNSLVWVSSIILIYGSTKLLFENNTATPVLASLFFFQPSILISSTQLLRDPFLILGVCLMCYGWIQLVKNKLEVKGVSFILFGYFLFISIRLYLSVLVLLEYFIISIIFFFKKEFSIYSVVCLLLPIFVAQYLYTDPHITDSLNARGVVNNSISEAAISDIQGKVGPAEVRETAISDIQADVGPAEVREAAISDIQANVHPFIVRVSTQAFDSIYKILDKFPSAFNGLRSGFERVNKNSGSKIDSTIEYDGIISVIAYFPRACQISFLAPFPHHWVEKGVQTGYIGRLISGVEVLIWYFVILGWLYVIFTEPLVIKPLVPMIILSTTVFILMGYIVPNVGLIFRMRQGFMIPFFIFGLYGLHSFFHLKINKV